MAVTVDSNVSLLMDLPLEILDMILAETATHFLLPHKLSRRPSCRHCLPQAYRGKRLSSLRLVNHHFNTYFTPVVFDSVTCEGSQRYQTLPSLVSSPISYHIRNLYFSISPQDFPSADLALFQQQSEETPHSTTTMFLYFASVEKFLIPLLRTLASLEGLILSVDYKGIPPYLYSTNKLISPCLLMLMRCVKGAELQKLDVLRLGILYHGGYGGFFSASEVGLEGMEARPRSVSVKLSDGWGNFTLMPVSR